jgi:hypothetical protein
MWGGMVLESWMITNGGATMTGGCRRGAGTCHTANHKAHLVTADHLMHPTIGVFFLTLCLPDFSMTIKDGLKNLGHMLVYDWHLNGKHWLGKGKNSHIF